MKITECSSIYVSYVGGKLTKRSSHNLCTTQFLIYILYLYYYMGTGRGEARWKVGIVESKRVFIFSFVFFFLFLCVLCVQPFAEFD